jgi:hypothetical protein
MHDRLYVKVVVIASAADLKFLPTCRNLVQELQIEKRHWNRIFASARLFPRFVSEQAAMYHELRKPGTRIPIAKAAAA